MQLTKIDDNHYLLKKGNVKIILTTTELDMIWRRANNLVRGLKYNGRNKIK